MPATTYTTSARVQHRLSADGVTLRQDDDTTALAQFINDASDEIEFYLLVRYDSATIATSGWVSKVCTDICAWLYCWRRLNGAPEGIAKMAEFAFERLEKIQCGELKVPGLATKKDAAPALSNIRPRSRPVNRPQVVPETSTGTAEDYSRHTDPSGQWIDYSV